MNVSSFRTMISIEKMGKGPLGVMRLQGSLPYIPAALLVKMNWLGCWGQYGVVGETMLDIINASIFCFGTICYSPRNTRQKHEIPLARRPGDEGKGLCHECFRQGFIVFCNRVSRFLRSIPTQSWGTSRKTG